MCLGEDAGEGGDDAGTVLDAETEVVGALLDEDGDGLELGRRSCAKGETRSGAAGTDLAGDAHEVADDGDAGGPGPAPRP
jgi:hypothetical protein